MCLCALVTNDAEDAHGAEDEDPARAVGGGGEVEVRHCGSGEVEGAGLC